jgi:integrase
MPIRKRGRGWQIDVQVGNRRARQTVSTKATALEVERRVRTNLERERAGLAPHRTLADILAEYLTTQAPALRAFASLKSKARLIRPYLDRPIERATDAAASMIRDGAHLTPATINRRLALLRRLCNLAYQWGWIDQPIGQRIKLLPERQERHIYLGWDDLQRLIDAAESEALRDAITLAAYTGLRRGELLALRAEHYREQAIYVQHSKNGKPRLVPVPGQAHDAATRLPLLVTAQSLRAGFERARAAAGMPHVRFHDLRHTYASWLVAGGVELRIVKDLMGHSTMQMTSRYAHLQQAALVDAVESASQRRKLTNG